MIEHDCINYIVIFYSFINNSNKDITNNNQNFKNNNNLNDIKRVTKKSC